MSKILDLFTEKTLCSHISTLNTNIVMKKIKN